MRNSDFDSYRLSEDHEAIREAIREITAAKITPFAAAVDAQARYPHEAHEALVASDALLNDSVVLTLTRSGPACTGARP